MAATGVANLRFRGGESGASLTVEHGAALDSVLVHEHRSATGFTNHPALSDLRESASVERASVLRGRTRLTSPTFLVKFRLPDMVRWP